VAAALATHVADVADDEQLELAADALVKHLLWIDVMDDVKARQSHPIHVTKREISRNAESLCQNLAQSHSA